MSAHAAVLALIIACLAPGRASAHRLDEYVEQTLLEIAPDRVILHVGLAPGVQSAPSLRQAIDADHDGVLSPAEQTAYADRVRRGLSLRLDRTPIPLRLASASAPDLAAMERGEGSIELTFEGSPPGGLHSGTLHFETAREVAGPTVYLVNAFLPKDDTIHLGPQLRNADESVYDVAVEVDAPSISCAPLGAALVAGAVAAMLVFKRRARAAPAELPNPRAHLS